MLRIWFLFIILDWTGFATAGRNKDPIADLSQNAWHCIQGDVIENNCMKCTCMPDKAYHCKKKKCYGVEEDQILLGKPTQAKCVPRMMYVYDETTCICSKFGYWPHEKCEELFKSLYIKTLPRPVKCQPDTFVIVGCNVCRCGSNGYIDKKHCTKNECSKNSKIHRRTITSNVHGTCTPGTWYSLAPCQFCHCVNENKLVCSTGNTRSNNILELGAYNLTVCGNELLREIVELIPDALRDGDRAEPPTFATEKSTFTHRTQPVTASSIPYENDLNAEIPSIGNADTIVKTGNPEPAPVEAEADAEYDSASEEKATNDTAAPAVTVEPMITLLPYDSEANDNDESNEVDIEEVSTSPASPTFQPLYQPQMLSEVPPTMTLSPTISPQQIKNPDILRIHLPSVLDKLLQMALRKSMVKFDKSEKKCVPGSTSRNECNVCFCLTNGKLLCTDKKCN